MGERRCATCGEPLTPTGIGRPPTFCSVACRRMAETERRRLDRRLERLEDQADELRADLAHYTGPVWKGQRARIETDLASKLDAITRAETRLRALLAASEPGNETYP